MDNPETPKVVELFDVRPRDLKTMAAVASTDQTRFAICGVRVHCEQTKVQLVATDGRRLARFDCGWAPPSIPHSFTVPVAMVKLLPSWRLCNVRYEPDSGALSFSNGDITISGNAKNETDKYPKWENVIPKEVPKIFPAEALTLAMPLLLSLMKLVEKITVGKHGAKFTGAGTKSPIFIQARDLFCVLMPMRENT